METALAERDPRAAFDLAAYDYVLPRALIAQVPLAARAAARMLTYRRPTGAMIDGYVRDLRQRLRPGDVLVVNDTRVIPARIRVTTETGARVELLLVRELEPGVVECLAKPARRLPPGRELRLPGARATVVSAAAGRAAIAFGPGTSMADVLERHGEVPLPPYIRRPAGPDGVERERYQTVYARVPGAVAAPTAGLHLTAALLERLRGTGIRVTAVTLHVGPATFTPVRARDIRRHRLEPEWVDIPAATAAAVAGAKHNGCRVIAVGTTTTRALESRADADGELLAGAGWADHFIYPGYRFKVIDGLLTNFHLPRSSLLILVCAFAGREAVLEAYAAAMRRGYRFYSYGDAMLIL